MNNARPFGAGSDALAAVLGELPVFVIAGDAVANAYFELAAARREGREYAAMFLVADRRAAYAYDLAAHVVRQGDYDRQRSVFDAIAAETLEVDGRRISDLYAPDPQTRLLLGDVSHLPDVLVVRSWCEAETQRRLRGYAHPRVARWYPARDLGRWKPAATRDVVVVWAPDYPAEKTALHTFALHDLHAKVAVVCHGGTPPPSRASYVDSGSAEVPVLLSRALCVIDATLDDPSWAQALAARDLSVAATTTSGAQEVADGLALYEPWSHRSIWAAALEALSRRRSSARESPPPLSVIAGALEASRPLPPEREPLVSVIIPTYNRRGELLRTLRKLQAQTYRRFEVLLVNDGGESIADLAGLDPRIRPFDRETNAGPFAQTNFALAQARGEYVQIGADDDEFYPDHLARLVEALERTGADVAHSNVLIRYESRAGDRFQTSGYNCSVFCHPLDRTEVYAASPVAGHALMVRRSAFERAGAFDAGFVLADQEIQIRLSQLSDFVHVPHVTAEWLVRESGEQYSRKKQADVVADLRRVFERHPAADRPYIAAVREQTLKNVAARPPGIVFPPVISRVPPGQAGPSRAQPVIEGKISKG